MIPALSGTPPAGVRVLIATRPVDFRRGADGLAATVQSVLRQDPFCGTIFVFRSKRADRVKMLVYDGTGLVLIWKRLEGAKFKWPAISDGVMRLSVANRNHRRPGSQSSDSRAQNHCNGSEGTDPHSLQLGLLAPL